MDKDKRFTDKIWQLCFGGLWYSDNIKTTNARLRYIVKWDHINPTRHLRVKLSNESGDK